MDSDQLSCTLQLPALLLVVILTCRASMSTAKIGNTICKAEIIICKVVYCYGATALAARMLEPVAPRVDVARRWGHVITFMACYRLCQHHLPSRSVEALLM